MFVTLPACGLALCAVLAQRETNYDEARVPDYVLPDPLLLADGTPVTTPELWRRRRGQMLDLLEHDMYGRSPEPPPLRFRVFEQGPALDGRATRRQVTLYFTPDDDGPQLDLLIYLPADATGPVPCFVGVNFQGNHACQTDPAIRLSTRWMAGNRPGVVDNRATDASRGVAASRWPVELITSRGFAVATYYAGDIDPDYHDEFANGIHAVYPELQQRGDNFATIAAWAWGLSRALDYFAADADIDARRVAAIGHSRMGKTSLWAAARDERFALAVSNNSGAGGAALSMRAYGETVARLNTAFPHWFCANFRQYSDNEAALPFDQHWVMALIAPRPLYVASATGDRWADPRGEFLATVAATPVYRLLGAEGMPATDPPAPGGQVAGSIGYHLREGEHDITAWDWERYLDFAAEQM